MEDRGGEVQLDQVSLGVLVTAVPRDAVDAAVAACGVVQRRGGGKLPAHVTAYLTMALCLFAEDDYEEVATKVTCAAERGGIDTLADYGMDIGPDTRKVTNPARTAARKTLVAAQDELATAERALPQLLNNPGTPKQKNAALPGVHKRIDTALAAADDAKTALRPIRAKILATDLDPDAQLARPHLGRRGLQMVLRLLAFNAEAWLAEHFNAY